LNLFASIDFAFSLNKKADYTAIVVVGVDSQNNYFVLDIDRFKTDKISDYFDRILRLHSKWGFKKLRAETTVAQAVIVKSLRDDYIRPHGLTLSIDDHRPTKDKEEWIESVLQPKYSNRQVYHYRGSNCQLLEEELVQRKPQHDDIKDALAACIEIAIPPSYQALVSSQSKSRTPDEYVNSRFGGIG
jgi:hypothetical protein